jgi:hypothetical protein
VIAMKVQLAVLPLAVLCWLRLPFALGQNPSGNPREMLQSALVQMGADKLNDVVLAGNAELIAGSTDETGTFWSRAARNGFHELRLKLPTASHAEIRALQKGVLQGTRSDARGDQHSIPEHNLLVNHSWFFPSIMLARLVRSQRAAISFVGTEDKDGQPVDHFVIQEGAGADGARANPKMAHLIQIDLYLDSQTLRPAALGFNLHPDSDALTDVPVEIRYDHYIQSSGVWLASHIQRYLNNSLTLDLTIQTEEFNTGFPESQDN